MTSQKARLFLLLHIKQASKKALLPHPLFFFLKYLSQQLSHFSKCLKKNQLNVVLHLRLTVLKCFFQITFHFSVTFTTSEYEKAFLNFKSLKPDFHRCQVLAVVINSCEGIGQRAVICTKERKIL